MILDDGALACTCTITENYAILFTYMEHFWSTMFTYTVSIREKLMLQTMGPHVLPG